MTNVSKKTKRGPIPQREETPMEKIAQEQEHIDVLKRNLANKIIMLFCKFMHNSGAWIERIEFEYADNDYEAWEIDEEDINVKIILQEDNG